MPPTDADPNPVPPTAAPPTAAPPTAAPLTGTAYVAAIERDAALLAATATGSLRPAVAACPGWDLADLLYHLGEVHRFWAHIVSQRAVDPSGYVEPARPADEDLPAWSRDSVVMLLDAIRGQDPATPVWTWAEDRTIGFVQRRQAQETTVHRWDAQRAVGKPDPIETAVAIDGIDEFFTHMLSAADGTVGGSVHLHATDGPGEWWVGQEGGAWVVVLEHRKGDVALRGPASDLLLALWRRVDIHALDVVGDPDVGRRFLGANALE